MPGSIGRRNGGHGARIRRMLALAINGLVLACAGVLVSPGGAGAASIDIAVEPTTSPYVTDVITLEGDYPGLREQYNKDPNNPTYVLVFFYCSPAECGDKSKWHRVIATDDQGNHKPGNPLYRCVLGPCKLRIKLSTPRAISLTFYAVVVDQRSRQSGMSKALPVTWTDKKPAPPPETAEDLSLELCVHGECCVAVKNQTCEKTISLMRGQHTATPELFLVAAMHGYSNSNYGIVIAGNSTRGSHECKGTDTCEWHLPGYGPTGDIPAGEDFEAGLHWLGTAERQRDKGGQGDLVDGPKVVIWIKYPNP